MAAVLIQFLGRRYNGDYSNIIFSGSGYTYNPDAKVREEINAEFIRLYRQL
ncbi:MAG: hypothetical protein K6E28_05345 [Eubacterium sp.]|nr:hypothetical protein [Eubacterium sp.]